MSQGNIITAFFYSRNAVLFFSIISGLFEPVLLEGEVAADVNP